MMDHLGEANASADIEIGLRRVLKEGKVKTRDMRGNHSTSEMGDAVKQAILSINYTQRRNKLRIRPLNR